MGRCRKSCPRRGGRTCWWTGKAPAHPACSSRTSTGPAGGWNALFDSDGTSVSWVSLPWPSRKRLGSDQILSFGLRFLDREAVGQYEVHFIEQFAAHFQTRRVVEPVQEVAAGRWLAELLVRVEAGTREELLNLAHGVQPLALPAAEAERTRCLDRPVLHAHQRRGR